MKCENWVDYWSEDDFWKDSRLWEINSRIFFERASRILEFKKSDCVLDIGCGPGYTETLLAPLVKSVYAVDVARQFIDICVKRCKDYKNVSVGHLDRGDYTNLEGFKGPFSIILCVSVVQYYRSVSEIEANGRCRTERVRAVLVETIACRLSRAVARREDAG